MLLLQQMPHGVFYGWYGKQVSGRQAVRVCPIECCLAAIRHTLRRRRYGNPSNTGAYGFRPRLVVMESRWHRTIPVQDDDTSAPLIEDVLEPDHA